MATFNKFNQFTEDMGKGVHDLSADTLTIALTAAANAPVATNSILGDLTEILYTNLSARVPTITSFVETSGVAKLILADLVLTASGGSVATFRYVVLYNDTPASPLNPLIAWYDYGSDLTLLDTETLTLDFDASGGVLTIT